MSPIALDPKAGNGHHDSFSLPTEMKDKDSKVHASAARSPEGGLFKVESEDTTYEEDAIRARFVDRGAEVTREFLRMYRCHGP